MTSQLDLVEVKPGVKFSRATLLDFLETPELVLFFGKAYELDYEQLSSVMHMCCKSDVAEALFSGDHSVDLQDYMIELDEWGRENIPGYESGNISTDPDIPTGEILPEVWASLEVEVAKSIKAVAEKLSNVVNLLPSKQGKMLFQSMLRMNKNRPTLGVHQAQIQHERQKRNLVVFDVSGSMTAETVRKIVNDVVAMSYNAEAHMAIVSNNTFYWPAGAFTVDDILDKAEYRGTHYETLRDLFDQDWGTVITVADYDSSPAAKSTLRNCTGHIDEVVDISLVDRPTYLAECIGQRADKVTPVLIGRSNYVLGSHYDVATCGPLEEDEYDEDEFLD